MTTRPTRSRRILTPPIRKPADTRLNKLLAQRGVASRREADQLIAAGRVTIDGKKAAAGTMVPAGARVHVDGKLLPPAPPPVYLKYYKPIGEICTTDRSKPRNVLESIGHKERLFPIGRLDVESSGLLLLSNDGILAHRILRAQYGCQKEYRVRVDQPLTRDFLQQMANGVEILGRQTLPAQVTQLGEREFSMVLVQGLNRQIRRMTETLGYQVERLSRVRVGPIQLGELRPGEWRELSPAEIAAFFTSVKLLAPRSVSAPGAHSTPEHRPRRSGSTIRPARPQREKRSERGERPERRSQLRKGRPGEEDLRVQGATRKPREESTRKLEKSMGHPTTSHSRTPERTGASKPGERPDRPVAARSRAPGGSKTPFKAPRREPLSRDSKSAVAGQRKPRDAQKGAPARARAAEGRPTAPALRREESRKRPPRKQKPSTNKRR